MSKSSKQIAAQVAKSLANMAKQNNATTKKKKGGKRKNYSNGNQNGGSIEQNDKSTKKFQGAPEMDGIVEFDELVTDILGSGGTGNLNIQTFEFNPGQALLFPLGSAECAKWTNWRCISAVPYLDHEVTEFATDGSTGKVYIAMDYNAVNSIATTKQQLADMHHACCMPCEDISLPLKTKFLNRSDPKYIRTGAQPAGTDKRLYDGGRLYVAAIGQAGTTKVSELHIRYKFKVELKTLLNPAGTVVPSQTSLFSRATNQTFTTNTPAPLQYATTVFDPLGIGAAVAGVYTPPAGVYRILCQATFNDSSNEVFSSVIELMKNGVSQSTVIKAADVVAGNASTPSLSISLFGVIACTGTDTFQLQVTLTGVAGTLIVLAGQAQIMITPA